MSEGGAAVYKHDISVDFALFILSSDEKHCGRVVWSRFMTPANAVCIEDVLRAYSSSDTTRLFYRRRVHLVLSCYKIPSGQKKGE